MGHPRLIALRQSVGSRFASGQLNAIDTIALIAGVLAIVWVQSQISSNYYRSFVTERIIFAPIAFALGASAVYTVWHLPQLILRFLRTYWWTVMLGCIGLFVWVSYVQR